MPKSSKPRWSAENEKGEALLDAFTNETMISLVLFESMWLWNMDFLRAKKETQKHRLYFYTWKKLTITSPCMFHLTLLKLLKTSLRLLEGYISGPMRTFMNIALVSCGNMWKFVEAWKGRIHFGANSIDFGEERLCESYNCCLQNQSKSFGRGRNGGKKWLISPSCWIIISMSKILSS